MIKMVLLRHIRKDGGTQARAKMDPATIEEYAEAMRDDRTFPPIVVFEDREGILWLGDGFHRVAAAEKADKKSLKADFRPGGLRDARLYAIGANATHGLRRTNADKRLAVSLLLDDPEWGAWSNREVARHAGVSEFLVRDMKEERVRLNRTPGNEGVPTVDTQTASTPSPKVNESLDGSSNTNLGHDLQKVSQPPSREQHQEPIPSREPEDHSEETAAASQTGADSKAHPQPAPAPIQSAPLPSSPDDRDARIAQLERLLKERDEEVAELKEHLEEMAQQLQAATQDNESMDRMLKSDDRLKDLLDEVGKVREENRILTSRNNGLMNGNADLAKTASSWKRKAEKAMRELKAIKGQVPDSDPVPPGEPTDEDLASAFPEAV